MQTSPGRNKIMQKYLIERRQVVGKKKKRYIVIAVFAVVLVAMTITVCALAFRLTEDDPGAQNSGEQTAQNSSDPTAQNSKNAESNSKTEEQSASGPNQSAESSDPLLPDPEKKVAYLTFDDGPSARTKDILDILDNYGIKATFFVIHTNYSRAEEMIKRTYDSGHTVGLHSYTHDYTKIYVSTDAFFADLEKIGKYVEDITGHKSTVTRFPGGSSNTKSTKYCRGIMTTLSEMVPARGYRYFDWNCDSGDGASSSLSPEQFVQNVLKNADRPNIYVLMHDATGKNTTVDALPNLIDELIRLGYTFESLTPDSPPFHQTVLN